MTPVPVHHSQKARAILGESVEMHVRRRSEGLAVDQLRSARGPPLQPGLDHRRVLRAAIKHRAGRDPAPARHVLVPRGDSPAAAHHEVAPRHRTLVAHQLRVKEDALMGTDARVHTAHPHVLISRVHVGLPFALMPRGAQPFAHN
eukprot:4410387-Prymnesium_polylepis.1